MKNLYRQSLPGDQKIEGILIAFGTYASGDIRYNIEGKEPKIIAAFIPGSSLIDQMAYFAYDHTFE